MLRDTKYKQNQTILKIFGTGQNKKIKVITMSCLRTKGIEDDNDIRVERGSVNDEKTEESISRTRSAIFELAFCNPWEWFFTGTLDPKKYDRTDLKKFQKNLSQWIRNYNKKYGLQIKYLLIPELHADGHSWHMHGFIMGLPVEHLQQFKIGDKMGFKLAQKVANGDLVYNWCPYMDKFGFCDLEPVHNSEAVSKYVTKYISKNLQNSVKELNANMYYCSHGLKRAEIVKVGFMSAHIIPTFTNDYCSVAWFTYSDELLKMLSDSII